MTTGKPRVLQFVTGKAHVTSGLAPEVDLAGVRKRLGVALRWKGYIARAILPCRTIDPSVTLAKANRSGFEARSPRYASAC